MAYSAYSVMNLFRQQEAIMSTWGSWGEGCVMALRIDYWDGRVIRGSSTKMVISQLWDVIFRHAVHH